MNIKKIVGVGCGCFSLAGITATLGTVVILLAGGLVWNSGPSDLQEVDPTWSIRVTYGADLEEVPAPAAAPIAVAIRESCAPSWNGLDILWEQFWYNAIYDGYEVLFWLESAGGSYDSYGLYMSGHTLLLRDGVGRDGYSDVVLTCEMSADDLATMVKTQAR